MVFMFPLQSFYQRKSRFSNVALSNYKWRKRVSRETKNNYNDLVAIWIEFISSAGLHSTFCFAMMPIPLPVGMKSVGDVVIWLDYSVNITVLRFNKGINAK